MCSQTGMIVFIGTCRKAGRYYLANKNNKKNKQMKWPLFTIVLTAMSFLYACKKTSSPGGNGGGGGTPFTPNCNAAAINFTADVFPIFQSVCGQSSCHNSGSVNGPGEIGRAHV